MAQFIGGFIGTVLGNALGALLGAFLVQFATNAVAKFKPNYGKAYLASFIGGLATNGLGFVIGFIVAASGNEISLVGYGILTIIGFLLYSWILGFLLKHTDTGAIGFKTGLLISLIYTGTVIAIVLAGAVLVGLIIK